MSFEDAKASVGSFFRRNSLTITLTIIAVCVFTIFILQALTISSLSKQVKSQNQVLSQLKILAVSQTNNAKDTKEEINGLSTHMDCLVQFYTQSDRANKAIANTDDCELTETKTQTKTALPVTPKPTSSDTQTAPTTTTPPSPTPTSDNSDDSFLDLLLSPVTSLINIL